jgi:hypothetical protein
MRCGLGSSAYPSTGTAPTRREAARQRTMCGLRHRQRAKAGGKPRLPAYWASYRARREGPTGVGEQGKRTQGLPRNLGDHVVSAA